LFPGCCAAFAAWCAADPGSIDVVGPGSAEHRFALHRVRDTHLYSLKYSITIGTFYEMAS
jgi:hypothetical protein